MQSKESLSYPNLRKGLLSTYISTLQPYLQIDTEYILYPTYYSRKNNQNLLYRKDTEFQYIYNIKRKNKKVLIMAQIQNFGFMPPVQESDFQHAPRPCGGIGKQRGKPEGT